MGKLVDASKSNGVKRAVRTDLISIHFHSSHIGMVQLRDFGDKVQRKSLCKEKKGFKQWISNQMQLYEEAWNCHNVIHFFFSLGGSLLNSYLAYIPYKPFVIDRRIPPPPRRQLQNTVQKQPCAISNFNLSHDDTISLKTFHCFKICM